MPKPSQAMRIAGRSYYGLLKAPYSNLLLKSRPRRLRGRIACDGLAITHTSAVTVSPSAAVAAGMASTSPLAHPQAAKQQDLRALRIATTVTD